MGTDYHKVNAQPPREYVEAAKYCKLEGVKRLVTDGYKGLAMTTDENGETVLVSPHPGRRKVAVLRVGESGVPTQFTEQTWNKFYAQRNKGEKPVDSSSLCLDRLVQTMERLERSKGN
ncbi:hypothetical protein JW826_00720 [Candidatus Woesearchaeota archaeon]|nr:hypothetical protein [Candidatus Woesearchaeota archaeon]